MHIAAGLGLGGNEAYPGVFQPFGGFVDGVTPEGGYVRLPTRKYTCNPLLLWCVGLRDRLLVITGEDGCVGIGIELKADLHAVFTPLLKRSPAIPHKESSAPSPQPLGSL